MIEIGQVAPEFTLKDQAENTVSLKDFLGKTVALYFYPKDDTPGCTLEACSFRDEQPRLQAAGVVVLGVSADDEKSHAKFAAKFQLNFPLLADPTHQTAEAYGVWGEKTMAGRTYQGITRTTFLINQEGVVSYIFKKPKNDVHAQEVLAQLQLV